MREIIEGRMEQYELEKAYFLDHTLFSVQWWVLILITIALWIIWIVLIDKKRLGAILLVGFIASMLAFVMDEIGIKMTLWIYPRPFTPFVNRLNVVDLAIIPVSYMLLYQYVRKWRSYVIVLIIMMLFAIFIAEPLFGKWYMYIKVKWEYWYSGPIYVAMALFTKWVVDKVVQVQDKAKRLK